MATQIFIPIEIFQGDNYAIPFSVTGLEGDVSSYTPYLTLRNDIYSDDIVYNKQLFWTDASGSGLIDFQPIDTSIAPRNYAFGVWVTNGLDIITAGTGTLIVYNRVRPNN
jgi:hypothetical protein